MASTIQGRSDIKSEMNSSASPSDIIIVVTLCRELYRKCRDVGFDEVSHEVRDLHTVLKHLKHEVEASDSPLNQDPSIWSRDLESLIGDCQLTLQQLDELLQKYGRVGIGQSPRATTTPTGFSMFGVKEMDTLGAIRVKLISHNSKLTQYLDTIQLHQSVNLMEELDGHGEQLEIILDKVDNIAAKLDRHRDGISGHNDDKEVWKQFRRELIATGFSSDVLDAHKDVLRAYIREIDQKGLLDEPRTPTPPSSHLEKWTTSVHSATSEDAPPSFSSLATATDDGISKEMVFSEDNMKFPGSMKFERRKPDTASKGLEKDAKPNVEAPGSTKQSRPVGKSQPQLLPDPIAAPQTAASNKKIFWHNNDSSSDEEAEQDRSSNGKIIRTSDLCALTQAVQLRIPASPSSFRSSLGYFGEGDTVHSPASRPKKQHELGSSASQPGAIPIPARSTRSSESFGTSPRLDAFKLGPDEHGNEIPPDAKWTKINRKLVSPEVLDQDRRRYEARPDFVAVLGVLSRAEIESLATRSNAIREARSRRSQEAHGKAPPMPPRPIPIQQRARPPFNRQTSSSSSSSLTKSSDSETSDSEHGHRNRYPDKSRTRRQASNTGVSNSGYPNPFGVPPQERDTSCSTAHQAIFMNSAQNQQQPPMPPQSFTYNPHTQPNYSNNSQTGYWPNSPPNHQQHPVRERARSERPRGDRDRNDRDKDIDRDGSRRRQSSTSKTSSKGTITPRKHRWKGNLAAASLVGGGIGGAAVELLHVLSEAAEGF